MNLRLWKYLLPVVLLGITAMAYAQEAGTSQAWATNSSKRMEVQAAQPLSASTKASARITLNPEQTYQTIDGFGWMLNQGSAKLLMQLPAADRRAVLEELYGADGLHASMVRVAIGACDLSESDYTYADSKDETLSNFAIHQKDLTTVIPVLQEILTINPKVKVLATAWTAPTWMKEGAAWYNSYVGGTLKTEYYSLYAEYFCRYIAAMAAWNIPIWGISVQNEPLNDHNDPSMVWTKETMYSFIAGKLGPKMRDAGYEHVRIIAYDHNCDVTDFPIHVARSKYVYGTAFHLYAGDISALSTVYNSTGKPVLFTEQYTGKDGDFSGDLGWHVQNVVIGSLNNYSTTAIEWNLCSDPGCSIHTSGGCSTCKGALTINGNSVSARNVSYYIIGHAGRVIDGGAQRIEATSSTGNLRYAAARNADGSIGVVAYNDSDQGRLLAIAMPDATGQTVYANHTLPGKGVLSVKIYPADWTALTSTPSVAPATKIIENGQLIILRNGVRYTAQGLVERSL